MRFLSLFGWDCDVLDEVQANFGRRAPLPPLFVSVPGTALDEIYGAKACAAVMKTCLSGCCEASSTRTRRVLRTMAAPILSSLMRIVAVQAPG
ncbi:hypothetical protein Bpro_3328 [Polaromonas sp. JS666]|nr:hypothetical protein Bpro_3328 [Polaromonas sp. JS666]